MRARATWATTRTSSATWPGSPAAADCVWRAAGRGARNDDTIPGHVALRMNGALDPAPERRPTVPPSCVGRHGSPQPSTRDFSGCLLSEDGLQVDGGLHNGGWAPRPGHQTQVASGSRDKHEDDTVQP